ILDWYDRYHCSQDAARDPDGVDRLKGRLYRLRYGDRPRAPKFDLATETDNQLIARLASENIFFRESAQRILMERLSAHGANEVGERGRLDRTQSAGRQPPGEDAQRLQRGNLRRDAEQSARDARALRTADVRLKLESLVFNNSTSRKARLQ